MKNSPQSKTDGQEQEIRELAHQLWERADCPTGRDLEFWMAAKKLVSDIQSAKSAPHTSTKKPAQRAASKRAQASKRK